MHEQRTQLLAALNNPLKILGLIVLMIEAILAAIVLRAEGTERLVLIIGMLIPLCLVVGIMGWMLLKGAQRSPYGASTETSETENAYSFQVYSPRDGDAIDPTYAEIRGGVLGDIPSGHYRVYCQTADRLWPQGRIQMSPGSGPRGAPSSANWSCDLQVAEIGQDMSILLVDLSEDLCFLDAYYEELSQKGDRRLPIKAKSLPPGMKVLARADRITKKSEEPDEP